MVSPVSFLEAPRQLAISAVDLQTYLDITRDDNPVHRDAKLAAQHGLPDVIVPGGLLVTIVERLIRQAFPNVAFLSFKARFARPAVLGQNLSFEGRVARRSIVEDGAEALVLRVKVTAEPGGLAALLDTDILVS